MTTVVLNAALVKERLLLLKEIGDGISSVKKILEPAIFQHFKTSEKGIALHLHVELTKVFKTIYIQATHRVKFTEKLEDAIFKLLCLLQFVKAYVEKDTLFYQGKLFNNETVKAVCCDKMISKEKAITSSDNTLVCEECWT